MRAPLICAPGVARGRRASPIASILWLWRDDAAALRRQQIAQCVGRAPAADGALVQGLKTVVDGAFACLVPMPTAHGLACRRDDILLEARVPSPAALPHVRARRYFVPSCRGWRVNQGVPGCLSDVRITGRRLLLLVNARDYCCIGDVGPRLLAAVGAAKSRARGNWQPSAQRSRALVDTHSPAWSCRDRREPTVEAAECAANAPNCLRSGGE
jgi:hypothetical protein